MTTVKPVVALAGNIGVGKTTVARHLAPALGVPLLEEPVGENPFLADFYVDMPKWVFHLNMYFLASRAKHLCLAQVGGGVLDRSLPEDAIFVRLALDDGVTTPDNFQVFDSLLDTLSALLPPLDLLLYLEADVPTLCERVAVRRRDFEDSQLDLAYLGRLQARYDEWISSYTSSRCLRIDTSQLDLRDATSADARYVIERVQGALIT